MWWVELQKLVRGSQILALTYTNHYFFMFSLIDDKCTYDMIYLLTGPGSVVSIATDYGLDGLGIESRWGWDFSRLSRPALGPTQPPVGAHPASCTIDTGSFPKVKSGRGVTLTPHSLLVPWSWKSRAVPLLPYGPYGLYRASVPVQGCTLPLPFMFVNCNWVVIQWQWYNTHLHTNNT
jgi:hypothetical protein